MEEAVPLKVYFERLNDERDRRYQDRFDSQEQAIKKADVALREYKAQANEFRGTLSDQAATFITRTEFDAVMKSYEEKTLDLSRAQRTQANWTIGVIISGALGAASLILAISARL